MKKRISLMVAMLLLLGLAHAGAAATEEKRILYLDFLAEYGAFVQQTMLSDDAVKGNLKKADKQGNMPFSIKGAEGTVEGLLIKDASAEKIAAPEWRGRVDNFTITLKYPGSVFPVLAAIHALTSNEKMNSNNHDVLLEAAYRQFNPDGLGQFEIANYRGQIIEKSKEGLAVKVTFKYLAGIEPDPPYSAQQQDVPVDLDSFVERWNFEGYTSNANLMDKNYKPYKLKTGKADAEGLMPFSMVHANEGIRVEVEGFTLNSIIQSGTLRLTPAKSAYNYLSTTFAHAIRPMYAISGIDNPTGLMRYRDLEMIAQQFQHEVNTSCLASFFEYMRVDIPPEKLKKMLDEKPFNGYQISFTDNEDNGVIIREYIFTKIGS